MPLCGGVAATGPPRPVSPSPAAAGEGDTGPRRARCRSSKGSDHRAEGSMGCVVSMRCDGWGRRGVEARAEHPSPPPHDPRPRRLQGVDRAEGRPRNGSLHQEARWSRGRSGVPARTASLRRASATGRRRRPAPALGRPTGDLFSVPLPGVRASARGVPMATAGRDRPDRGPDARDDERPDSVRRGRRRWTVRFQPRPRGCRGSGPMPRVGASAYRLPIHLPSIYGKWTNRRFVRDHRGAAVATRRHGDRRWTPWRRPRAPGWGWCACPR
ncbi:MAG: hypothetical protein AVDCRST_MAG19-3962 [uncultured Thermomicrobiales bacterium]|uniref:Uncharacterized protein n=1 Tax=uncultured Thermomicrobiales bacterium TaxID=1645740 RepID=A0A6J4VKA8_9BACT|nr:MAG: hypothetical protein AVDCRST_MAG19-3962 [uncultured Thermomicrobiales bacterium]